MIDTPPSARRPDLDALRVFAFVMLILYHTGMGYVTWGWHVKSAYAGTTLELPMMLMSPWRLPLLFFISGVAMAMLAAKLGTGRFMLERVWRLFVPLVFGMVVIVMPQAYFELRTNGEIEPGILAFWPHYLDFGSRFSIVTPTWNHLWYVAYIFVYALILAPFLPHTGKLARLRLERVWQGNAGLIAFLILPVLPLLLIRFTLVDSFPTTHNLVWDWATHAYSLTFVIFGALAARSQGFWQVVDRVGKFALGLTVAGGALLVFAYLDFDARFADSVEATLWRALRLAYAWWMIVTLIWLARRLIRSGSTLLSRLNVLIFPVFIAHQTITVSAIYLITAWDIRLGGPGEFAVVAAITLVGSWAVAEAASRIAPLRPLMGMKFRP
ncbi:MAG: acyltransferase family protein [Glycocaulis sp.]